MEKRSKEISLKTLLLTFIRRFDLMLLVLIPAFLVTVLVSNFMIAKTYYSELSLSQQRTIIKETQYDTIKKYATSTGAITKAVDQLKKEKIFHADGSAITSEEIKAGLSFNKYEANSIYVTYSFTSPDKTITKSVLSQLTAATIDYLKDDESAKLTNVTISKPITDPQETSRNKKIFLVGTAVSVVVAFTTAFIVEVALDKVYDKSDFELAGVKVTEINLPKGRKGEK